MCVTDCCKLQTIRLIFLLLQKLMYKKKNSKGSSVYSTITIPVSRSYVIVKAIPMLNVLHWLMRPLKQYNVYSLDVYPFKWWWTYISKRYTNFIEVSTFISCCNHIYEYGLWIKNQSYKCVFSLHKYCFVRERITMLQIELYDSCTSYRFLLIFFRKANI